MTDVAVVGVVPGATSGASTMTAVAVVGVVPGATSGASTMMAEAVVGVVPGATSGAHNDVLSASLATAAASPTQSFHTYPPMPAAVSICIHPVPSCNTTVRTSPLRIAGVDVFASPHVS